MMFKDTEKELERLEAELLEDDEDTEFAEEMDQEEPELPEDLEATQRVKLPYDYDRDATRKIPVEKDTVNMDATRRIPVPEDLDSTRRIPSIAPARSEQKIYNSDRIDGDLQTYSDELEAAASGGHITGLLVIAACLTVGILAVLIWWIIRYWGAL